MSSVAIVTDSSACLPAALAEQLCITVVPLTLVIDGRPLRDGIDTTAAAFYSQLRATSPPPTTAPPPPGAYVEAFRAAARGADAVLCVTISHRFSAMYAAAETGARRAGEEIGAPPIRVLDSGTAAMAQGLVAVAAARAAAGASLEEVVRVAEATARRVQLLAVLDTLLFLARSGRVPRIAHWAAALLSIKPVVELRPGGEVALIQRCRTMSRATARLVELVRRNAADGPISLAVMHAGAPEEAARLREAAGAAVDCREIFVTEFTPVMGVHTGPGLLAVAYCPAIGAALNAPPAPPRAEH